MKKVFFTVFCFAILACSGKNKDQNESVEANKSTTTVAVDSSKDNVNDNANAESQVYSKNLSWNNYQFEVVVKSNSLYIKPKGKSGNGEAAQHNITGYTVVNSEVGDLNVDGMPEVLVYLVSDGSGSYGSLIGYSLLKSGDLLQLELPDLSLDKKNSKGYMGHDKFEIVENTLVRNFPVYKDGDSNANPTGGTRQLQYKLPKNNGKSLFYLDRVSEY